MGGLGSGNWYRFDKKSTVEESLTLEMRDFHKRSMWRSSGTLTWRWASGSESGIGYFVTWVTTYTVGDGEVVGRQLFRIFKFDPATLAGLDVREISHQTVPDDFRNKHIHRCWRMTVR